MTDDGGRVSSHCCGRDDVSLDDESTGGKLATTEYRSVLEGDTEEECKLSGVEVEVEVEVDVGVVLDVLCADNTDETKATVVVVVGRVVGVVVLAAAGNRAKLMSVDTEERTERFPTLPDTRESERIIPTAPCATLVVVEMSWPAARGCT